MSLNQKFIERYKYNTHLDITKCDLETIKYKSGESLFEYIIRWWAKAIMMRNEPPEEEQFEMVIKNALLYLQKNK